MFLFYVFFIVWGHSLASFELVFFWGYAQVMRVICGLEQHRFGSGASPTKGAPEMGGVGLAYDCIEDAIA